MAARLSGQGLRRLCDAGDRQGRVALQRARRQVHDPSGRRGGQAASRTRGAAETIDRALALLSGVLLALSVPRFGHPAIAWVALSPLLAALLVRRRRTGGLPAGRAPRVLAGLAVRRRLLRRHDVLDRVGDAAVRRPAVGGRHGADAGAGRLSRALSRPSLRSSCSASWRASASGGSCWRLPSGWRPSSPAATSSPASPG